MDPKDLEEPVLKVLKRAARGVNKDRSRAYLTPYQVLDRLPVRDELLGRGKVGKKAGSHTTAASTVREILRRLVKQGVVEEWERLDTRGIRFKVGVEFVKAGGNKPCGLYRLKE